VNRSEVFVRRCLVCGLEIQTVLGPETHSESARQLRDHLGTHVEADLFAYVFVLNLKDSSEGDEYSPEFQDEYRRLWHEAASRADGLQKAMEAILDLTDPGRTNRWEVAHEIAFAALEKHRA